MLDASEHEFNALQLLISFADLDLPIGKRMIADARSIPTSGHAMCRLPSIQPCRLIMRHMKLLLANPST